MSAAAIALDKNAVKRDVQDILGVQFNTYKSKVYAKSITNPSAYFEARDKMETLLKKTMVTAIYDTIYNLLRYGIILDGTTEVAVCIDNLQPMYPSNLVNDEALKVSAMMNTIIDDIISIIHPSDYESIAADKMKIKARAIGL